MAIFDHLASLFAPSPPTPDRTVETKVLLSEAAAALSAVAEEITTGHPFREVKSPARLAALHATGLLDTPPEETFDRFTNLARKIFKTPEAFITLVAADRVFFLSMNVPEGAYGGAREGPIVNSICPILVETCRPLVIGNADLEPTMHDHPAVADYGVRAYIGAPLIVTGNYALGTMCAVDFVPRSWAPDDLEIITDLAQIVIMLIEIRTAMRHPPEEARC